MKIISWNINGYRSVTGQNPSRRYDVVTKENKLFAYINSENPDIIGLQEIKADFEQIDEKLRNPGNYFAYYNSCKSKKGYSGVATFSKKEPLKVNFSIGEDRFDVEGRVIELVYQDFTHLNIYFPKGYTDHERLRYKLSFYDRLFKYLSPRIKNNESFIISGDYNTAHKEIDLARPKDNTNTSGFLAEERVKLDEMIDLGFIDSFRQYNNNNGNYTWWAQRGRARENNIGWRIDYHFITENLLNNLQSGSIQPHVHGSDHCPVLIEIK